MDPARSLAASSPEETHGNLASRRNGHDLVVNSAAASEFAIVRPIQGTFSPGRLLSVHSSGSIYRVLSALVLSFALPVLVRAIPQPADVTSVVGDGHHWAATHWSTDDTALFGGPPIYRGNDNDLILLRYSFYVSEYDADRLCPLWVAHIDEGDALAKARLRTAGHNREWQRLPSFFADRNLVAYSTAHHLPYTVQNSYTDCNPSELPPTIAGRRGRPAEITRGHNASNDEMKLEGTESEGVISQHESFSLANVSPQTQENNAPMWAALEHDCLIWASKLGRVAVITGPVFAPTPVDPVTGKTNPPPVSRLIYTHGRSGPLVPIPTHFFKVIIGRIDGKLAAVGFLVPHLSTLPKDGYRAYVTPIATIEKVTGLTFMPDARLPAFKDAVDPRWLAMLPPTRRGSGTRPVHARSHVRRTRSWRPPGGWSGEE